MPPCRRYERTDTNARIFQRDLASRELSESVDD